MCYIASDRNLERFSFPRAICVNRPHLNFRGFCGTIASGIVRKGDEVMVLPSRKTSRVKSHRDLRWRTGRSLRAACRHADAGRRNRRQPRRHDRPIRAMCRGWIRTFDAMVVWMTEQPMVPGKQYLFKHGNKMLTGSVSTLRYQVDVNTLQRQDRADAAAQRNRSLFARLHAAVLLRRLSSKSFHPARSS